MLQQHVRAIPLEKTLRQCLVLGRVWTRWDAAQDGEVERIACDTLVETAERLDSLSLGTMEGFRERVSERLACGQGRAARHVHKDIERVSRVRFRRARVLLTGERPEDIRDPQHAPLDAPHDAFLRKRRGRKRRIGERKDDVGLRLVHILSPIRQCHLGTSPKGRSFVNIIIRQGRPRCHQARKPDLLHAPDTVRGDVRVPIGRHLPHIERIAKTEGRNVPILIEPQEPVQRVRPMLQRRDRGNLLQTEHHPMHDAPRDVNVPRMSWCTRRHSQGLKRDVDPPDRVRPIRMIAGKVGDDATHGADEDVGRVKYDAHRRIRIAIAGERDLAHSWSERWCRGREDERERWVSHRCCQITVSSDTPTRRKMKRQREGDLAPR